MKKKYVSPMVVAVNIDITNMCAVSLPGGSTDVEVNDTPTEDDANMSRENGGGNAWQNIWN